MKKTFYLLIIILLSSCNQGEGIYLEINNSSKNPINEISFGTFEQEILSFKKIESGESAEGFIELNQLHSESVIYQIKYSLKDGRMVTSVHKEKENKQLIKRVIQVTIEDELPEFKVENTEK